MSYALLQPWQFEVNQPGGLTHAGSPGWSTVPYPAWGVNPNQAGPARIGVGADLTVGMPTPPHLLPPSEPPSTKTLGLPTWGWVAVLGALVAGALLVGSKKGMRKNGRRMRGNPSLGAYNPLAEGHVVRHGNGWKIVQGQYALDAARWMAERGYKKSAAGIWRHRPERSFRGGGERLRKNGRGTQEAIDDLARRVRGQRGSLQTPTT